jgi:hypothetical protein
MATTKEQDRNLRDVAEELFGYSPCLHCKRFIRDVMAEDHCPAFPDKIPDEIFMGRNLHKEPYPGDHGILFQPDE